MTLELVKYHYGKVVRYTAFCLTPKLAKPRTIIRGGRSFKVTNKGPSSRAAKHFETPSAVLAYLRSSGHKLLNLDLSALPETAIRNQDGRRHSAKHRER